MHESLVVLEKFLGSVKSDLRVNPRHISIYMSLFQEWTKNNFESPVILKAKTVMELSKINSRTTFNKCINDLHEYGYIKYIASRDHYRGSEIYL
jgi:replication initiation and membrane attachment protein DnaB